MSDTANTPRRLDDEYNWPPAASIPDPDVFICFHGLMSFAHHRRGFCEVGIHSAAANHKLGIYVVEVPDSFFTNMLMQATIDEIDILYKYVGDASSFPEEVIRIEVSEPLTPGVSYYQVDDAGRSSHEWPPTADPNDFRWIIDFESEELHKTQLKKRPGVLRPKLRIKAGVFSTLLTTRHKFRLRTPYFKTEPRSVGYFFGASIDLKPKGFTVIRIGSHEVLLNKGKRYFVLIDNSCPGDICEYKPNSPVKQKRNDFYQYYNAVKVPDYEDEFELVCEDCSSEITERQEQAAENIAPMEQRRLNVQHLLELLGVTLSTDKAPCGGTGFGGSGAVDEPQG